MVIVFFRLSTIRQEWCRYGEDTDKRQSPQMCHLHRPNLHLRCIPNEESLSLPPVVQTPKVFTEPVGAIDGIQSVCCPAGSKQICFCPIAIIIIGSIPRGSLMHPFISLETTPHSRHDFSSSPFFHRLHQIV